MVAGVHKPQLPPTMKTDPTCAAPEVNDDVIALLLSVARRADELVRTENERAPERDFWREAEQEVFERRLSVRVPVN